MEVYENEEKHWQECECGIKTSQEAHKYENGICTLCGLKQNSDSNNNNDSDNNNDNQNDNSNNNNNQNDNSNNNNNNQNNNSNNNNNNQNDDSNNNNNNNGKDDSTSQKDIPNTGGESMRIAFMITAAILGAALLIKLSREE